MERSVSVRLRAEVGQFKSAMAEGAASVTALGAASDKAGSRASAMGDAAVSAGNSTKAATTSMAQAAVQNEQAWTRSGIAIAAAGALVTAAVVGATRAAISWESAWAGVTKTVDGTPAQLAEIETGLRGLATTLPSTHQEIAAVAEAAGQLGVATPNVVGFTRTMIALGETTNLTADEAATAIAQISNVMGTMDREGTEGIEGIERFGSALVQLGNNGASTEREILMMAQRIAASAALIGMTEADVLAFSNALASVGIAAEAGGSAISRVMQNISMAVADGGSDLEAFAEVAGVSAQDFATSFREDPAEAITTFIEGLGRIDEAGGNVFAVLDELGMSDIRVSNALLTMASAGDLLRDSLLQGAEAWESNTALMAEAEQRYATTESKMQVARNSLADVGITIGEALLPVVAGASEAIAGFANMIGNLPEPVLHTAGAIAAVVGPLALLGGGFLVTLPHIMQTTTALKEMGIISPGVAAGVGKVASSIGKMALRTAGVMALAAAVGAVADHFTSGAIVQGAEKLESNIRSLAETGDISNLNDQFDNFGQLLGFNRVEAEGLGESMSRLFNGDITDGLADFISLLPGVTGEADLINERFSQLDSTFASMVAAGDINAVRDSMAAIYAEAEANGVSVDQVNQLFGQTTDALFGVEEAAAGAGASVDNMSVRMNTATGVMEELTDAQKDWLDSIGEADAGFIGFESALDAVIAKNKEVAESTADSASSAEESWGDFYDGASVAVEDWIAELENQMRAQQDWETNMILLSGRVSEGVLAELATLGPEGAPLIADLVNASDEELSRLETVFGERTELATESYAQALMDAGPIIAQASAELGDEVAREMAARIASGELTVQQALEEYGLEPPVVEDPVELEVEANTEVAWGTVAGFVAEVDRTTGTMHINGETTDGEAALAWFLTEVGTSSEGVTINGEPMEAFMTLNELLGVIRSSEEPVQIGGDNTYGRNALADLLYLVLGSEEDIEVGADTSSADSTVARWTPPDKTGTVTYSPQMLPWTPPMKTGVVQYNAIQGALFNKFDSGGYTGDGGKYEPAGIVHKGEWVITKERTQQYLPILRQIHEGSFPFPGYAAGGPVGWSPGDARTAYSSTNQPNDSLAPIVVTLGGREQSRGNLTVNAPVTAVGPNANDVAAQILRQVRGFTRGGARL